KLRMSSLSTSTGANQKASSPCDGSTNPTQERLARVPAPYILDSGFGGDGEAASRAKSFGRNFKSRSSLLPFVFGTIHHLNHPFHQSQIVAVITGNLFRVVRILDVFFQNGIQDLVGW